MKESAIERHTNARVISKGGFTRKIIYQGRKGSPDRWCFFPGGKLCIIELKRLGKTPSPEQAEEIRKLKAQGFDVHVADSKEQVDEILNDY